MDNTIYIAFMGCGWRFPFLFGVAKFIEEHTQTNHVKYVGVSGGAVVAYSLLAKVVDITYKNALSKIAECPYAPFGMCDFIERVAHECFHEYPKNDSLTLVATNISSRSTEYFTAFESKDDLCKCMRASSHIPLLGGSIFYKHRGTHFVDGEMSVTIEAIKRKFGKCIIVDFCENADIKPTISIPRWWSYFPQNESIMEYMFNHGYERAKAYFQSHHRWSP